MKKFLSLFNLVRKKDIEDCGILASSYQIIIAEQRKEYDSLIDKIYAEFKAERDCVTNYADQGYLFASRRVKKRDPEIIKLFPKEL